MNYQYLDKYAVTEGPVIIGLPSHLNQIENFEEVDTLLGGTLDALVKEKVLSTKAGRITSTGATIQREFKKVIAVGLGNTNELSYQKLTEYFGSLYQYLRTHKIHKAQVLLDSFTYDKDELAEILSVSSYMSLHEFESYKSDKKVSFFNELDLTLTTKADIKDIVDKYQFLGEGIGFARDLSETPPNILYPEHFATLVDEKLSPIDDVTVEIKDDETLEHEGFGLLTAVGKASSQKPRLVTIEYKPSNATNENPIALVGKGITYDTGGYSIKTKNGMPNMKRDMSGAANVVGMLVAASQMKLPLHIIGVIALAENMIDSNGMRPDDVYISLSGHSVEVTNTDAEGRLVLADAVYHASQYSPQVIMDFATLTGAVVAALGGDRTGVFTNQDSEYLKDILEISKKTEEHMWQLPISELEEKNVKSSEIADFTNSIVAPGGASFAACFIKQFVGDKPWVHFDIAGASSTRKASSLGPKGATGIPIRTIIKYLEQL